MKKYANTGIAIDNCCAIEFIGNSYRVISSKRECNAYKLYKKKGVIHLEKLEKEIKHPITMLYEK